MCIFCGSKKTIKSLKTSLYKTTEELQKITFEKEQLKKSLQTKDNLSQSLSLDISHLKKELNLLTSQLLSRDKEIEALLKTIKKLQNNEDLESVVGTIKDNRNVLVTGGAGSGKSYILRQLLDRIPALRGNITSTTGISAINIDGITIHSWSGMGVNTANTSKNFNLIVNRIRKKPSILNRVTSCKILAIDEISMLSGETLTLLNRVFQKIRSNYDVFGGIKVVFLGDFAQLPPVQKDNNAIDYAFKSEVWADFDFEYINLTTIHRQKDKHFIQTLRNLRFGHKNDKTVDFFSDCIVKENSAVPKDIPRLLFTNAYVKNTNNARLQELPGKNICFPSRNFIAEVYYDDQGNRLLKYIRNAEKEEYIKDGVDILEKNTKALDILELKENARVMLIRNEALELGFANGTLGNITKIDETNPCFSKDSNVIRLKTRNFDIPFDDIDNPGAEIVLVREQFPIVLAYAVTVHKAQGLTFDSAVVQTFNSFANGQTYVALSRVKTKDGLKILKSFSVNDILTSKEVANFYKKLEITSYTNLKKRL